MQTIDTFQEDLLKAINNGERDIRQVDWVTFLSTYAHTFCNSNFPISSIAWAWVLISEIEEPTKRINLLCLWQDAAPKSFPIKEECDEFIANCDCLVRMNSRLRWLYIHESAQLPHTYDEVWGGKKLNELALLWSDNHVTSNNLIALASEIHNTAHPGDKAPIIEYFLYSSRNYDKLYFDNIYDFSRNLFLAESFRKYLVAGKMYTSEPIAFIDIKRKIRNACFDEYIRLRLVQIGKKMEDDNSLLLDPTIDDLYRELYNQESNVVKREFMFEDFRDSQVYHESWYDGRPEVLQMMKYFMDYLNWKMEHLHDERKHDRVIVNNGDYVAGNKHTGTVIGTVAAGGIGVQVNHGKQEKADIPTEPKAEEPKPQEQPQSEESEVTDGAIDLHLELFKAAMLKVQDVKYSEIKFATAIMKTYEWYAVLRLGQDIGLLDGYTDLITLMKEGNFKHKPTNPQNVNPYKNHINAEPLYPNWQCAHRASEPYFRKFKFIADNTYSIYKLGCKEHHIRPFGSDK